MIFVRTASVFFILVGLCVNQTLQQQQVTIGAFFYENELDYENEFVSAVRSINEEADAVIEITAIVKHLNEADGSAMLQEQACDLIENGVVAIFGPSSKMESDVIALVCNNTGIPHIEFDVSKEETITEKINHQMTVNLYPSQLILSKAYADIVQNFGWRKFSIVYDEEDERATTRLQDLLQLRDMHNEVVRVRKFKRNDDYRVMWKSIRGERRVVLDCAQDMLVEVLNASIEFDLTGQFNHLFLTNLETYSDNLEELGDNVTFAVNMTAARLLLNEQTPSYVNPYGEPVIVRENVAVEPDEQPERTLLHDLIYDAVQLFAQAVKNVSYAYQISTPRVKCDFDGNGRTWAMGRYLSRVMKATSGVNNTNFRTSNLQFDEDGQRINFNIEIYDPMDNFGIAVWDTKGQITPLNVEAKVAKKIVYRVATRIGAPYFMEIPEAVEQNITGNARYEGYAVDLIDELSKEIGFEYLFIPVADNGYGKYNKDTKQWDGIIGEVINNDAHMGICDLTITQARRTVVDFTVPFMQLGISILAYKSPYVPKSLDAFLMPFATEVWIYILVSVIIMSFLKVFVARISKAEWVNPHPCDKDPESLENEWNLSNTFYLTIASIMTAGCDILPRSPPLRMFEGMWWIFAIIIANSYTANLAAFLTSTGMANDINSIKDLGAQKKVKFGTVLGGSTYNLFAESNETVYRLAFNLMNSDDPSAYTKTNPEGVERVLKNNGSYMFLMETTGLEYAQARNCELRAIGEKFGEKHYAIAVPFGAEYRSNLSVAILKLSEKGRLFDLKQKWWNNADYTCREEIDPDATPDMTFEDVRGIFYTLAVGVLLGFIIGIAEFLIYTQQVALEEKITIKEAFLKEIKFVFCFWNLKKPIAGATPASSLVSTPRRSLEKTPVDQTPKSSRRFARNSEELRELPGSSSSNSDERTQQRQRRQRQRSLTTEERV